MQRSHALTVAKSAAKLKILAKRARENLEAAGLEADNWDGVDGGEDGYSTSLLGSESVRGGSPVSRPVTPLSDDAARSLYSSYAAAAAAAGLSPMPAKAWFLRDVSAVSDMLLSSKVNVLMVCVPLGIAAQLAGWGATAVFLLNFLALIPLALLLGDITEDLAGRFGETVGGLLNASFGNVVELILSLAALRQGLYTVVSSSLLGSILSNLLLVLGCCFLFGGLRFRTQSFNAVANQATSSLLLLSCISIIIPTAAGQLSTDGSLDSSDLLAISRGTAVVMLVVYGCYLSFQLHTHADMFKGDDGDEEPAMSLAGALVGLAAITVAVAACSEFLCGAIEDFSEHTGLSQSFLGIIVLPIAGNACEHITAVVVALKDKMDLSLGVAVGSSIQIAIFVLPVVVVVGWASGHAFSLDFDAFAVMALTISVIHANFATSDARSHWLIGVALMSNYLLIALVYVYK